ncbi:hypothetical protein ASPZODRAFT_20094 [Penicilliopsis zonata CBS 506.65]|uniref:Glutathione S-transferase n=1 Tax=Penicilliopsis zonata CBS 506.65 TaxID=1073090 RepID=A0A1L9S6M3_9EURO|nr:hypothetical protein ASPZODRAFT_20094 [Penicilliopsis zonata CBS 506.65]OJJ42816.1 hypothetical protein ASPZODRAFT_20094 [Penicilliopsis zonata CBS 506.65]
MDPDITLYTAPTANGIKISIALEELGIPYKAKHLTLPQRSEEWYLQIHPNAQIPALVDNSGDGESSVRVFESGSILLYLADKYDPEYKISYPRGTAEWTETINWLFFQNASLGPMQSQAVYFLRKAADRIEPAIQRYERELRRVYTVVERRLASSASGFLVGDHISIADISLWGPVRGLERAGIDLAEFPHVAAWKEKLAMREGVQRGISDR